METCCHSLTILIRNNGAFLIDTLSPKYYKVALFGLLMVSIRRLQGFRFTPACNLSTPLGFRQVVSADCLRYFLSETMTEICRRRN